MKKLFVAFLTLVLMLQLSACKDKTTELDSNRKAATPETHETPKTQQKIEPVPEEPSGTTLNIAPPLIVISNELSFEALRGTSMWRYKENGREVAIASDSLHPLQCKRMMPVLDMLPYGYLFSDPYSARLQFGIFPNEIAPDKVSVRCWNESAWDNTDSQSENIPVDIVNGNIFITMKKESSIYEVTAEWNSTKDFGGTATYSFCTKSNPTDLTKINS